MAWAILVLMLALIVIALMRFNAPSEPDRFATANMAKRFFIHRAGRKGFPPRSAQWTVPELGAGSGLFKPISNEESVPNAFKGADQMPDLLRLHQ